MNYNKAFDTVNYGVLRAISRNLCCNDDSVGLHDNYLTKRWQTVCIADKLSTSKQTHRRVLQGSILEPLLFTIYTGTINEC